MAFPSVAATSQGNDAVNATSHVLTLPISIAAGDLLIMSLAMDGNTTFTWPAGWTTLSPITNSGGDGTLETRYRIADGTEGVSITVTTGASEAGSYICWRIGSWHGTTPPEAGTPVTGNSTTPDAPSLTASWGSADNLFIVIIGWGASTLNITAYPTNYGISQMTDAANNAAIAGIAIAGRELASDTDNPGTATLGATPTWVANTMVVRPAAAGGVTVKTLAALGVG